MDSAFIEWVRDIEREAVLAVSQMYPSDTDLKAEAEKDNPSASVALTALRNHFDASSYDAKYWVAYHLLQHTLHG